MNSSSNQQTLLQKVFKKCYELGHHVGLLSKRTALIDSLKNNELILNDLDLTEEEIPILTRFFLSKQARLSIKSINLSSKQKFVTDTHARSNTTTSTGQQKITPFYSDGSRLLKSIIDLIKKSKHLIKLEFSWMYFNHDIIKKLGEAISHSYSADENLLSITFNNCPIGDDGMKILFPYLGLIKAPILKINNANLTDVSAEYICSIINSQESQLDTYYWNSTLRSYPDEWCKLSIANETPTTTGTELEGVSYDERIKLLSVVHNNQQQVASSSSTIFDGKLKNNDPNDEDDENFILNNLKRGLRFLSVSGNHLGTKMMLKLSNCMRKNQWLISLDLSNNNIDIKSIASMAKLLKTNSSLVTLCLAGNPCYNDQLGIELDLLSFKCLGAPCMPNIMCPEFRGLPGQPGIVGQLADTLLNNISTTTTPTTTDNSNNNEIIQDSCEYIEEYSDNLIDINDPEWLLSLRCISNVSLTKKLVMDASIAATKEASKHHFERALNDPTPVKNVIKKRDSIVKSDDNIKKNDNDDKVVSKRSKTKLSNNISTKKKKKSTTAITTKNTTTKSKTKSKSKSSKNNMRSSTSTITTNVESWPDASTCDVLPNSNPSPQSYTATYEGMDGRPPSRISLRPGHGRSLSPQQQPSINGVNNLSNDMMNATSIAHASYSPVRLESETNNNNNDTTRPEKEIHDDNSNTNSNTNNNDDNNIIMSSRMNLNRSKSTPRLPLASRFDNNGKKPWGYKGPTKAEILERSRRVYVPSSSTSSSSNSRRNQMINSVIDDPEISQLSEDIHLVRRSTPTSPYRPIVKTHTRATEDVLCSLDDLNIGYMNNNNNKLIRKPPVPSHRVSSAGRVFNEEIYTSKPKNNNDNNNKSVQINKRNNLSQSVSQSSSQISFKKVQSTMRSVASLQTLQRLEQMFLSASDLAISRSSSSQKNRNKNDNLMSRSISQPSSLVNKTFEKSNSLSRRSLDQHDKKLKSGLKGLKNIITRQSRSSPYSVSSGNNSSNNDIINGRYSTKKNKNGVLLGSTKSPLRDNTTSTSDHQYRDSFRISDYNRYSRRRYDDNNDNDDINGNDDNVVSPLSNWDNERPHSASPSNLRNSNSKQSPYSRGSSVNSGSRTQSPYDMVLTSNGEEIDEGYEGCEINIETNDSNNVDDNDVNVDTIENIIRDRMRETLRKHLDSPSK